MTFIKSETIFNIFFKNKLMKKFKCIVNEKKFNLNKINTENKTGLKMCSKNI